MHFDYKKKLKSYIEFLKNNRMVEAGVSQQSLELKFDSIYVNDKNEYQKILEWYTEQREKCNMGFKVIPLNECRGWRLDDTGTLKHESGEFFTVDGIRVKNSTTREVKDGWDQPILTQVGYDGGILGLLRKSIFGVPHYLVEAKAEPGNYNFVQISTTVQATFSNLKKAHKGNATPYSEYFLEPEKNGGKVIFEQWMSEDGGRLLNKRNRSMIVQLSDEHQLDLISDRYKWVTLYQLKQLIKNENAIVAPHIRGIISGI
jgi:oxidase EvaA